MGVLPIARVRSRNRNGGVHRDRVKRQSVPTHSVTVEPARDVASGTVCPYPCASPPPDKSLLHGCRTDNCSSRASWLNTSLNMRTGVSRTFKAQWPLRIVPRDDGTSTLINHGNILWTFFEGDAGGPGLFIFTGHVVMEVSADGFATSVSRAPKTQDVCALLA